ncbi:MAG: 5-formyltetrahydrofolate cyclo-ligase [Lachnospiraceae bacterium]|jgi:5-formyltetrahydrofolate cyclo-ligase|nr:5-formyltetrahydrofolate cyclo-ligase [Lachnospiraceae bacterium]
MATKSEIRKSIKAIKSEFEPAMIDFAGDIISYKVMALNEYKEAECLFTYVDYNKEVRTITLIKDALKIGKKVAVPKVYSVNVTEEGKTSKYMKFHYISSLDDLKEGFRGIKEPSEELPVADIDSDKAIMVMPVVAFDEDKNRVGYGGGVYDRYLSTHNVIKKIGVAYEEQKVDKIDDIDSFDIKPDVIITQKSIY